MKSTTLHNVFKKKFGRPGFMVFILIFASIGTYLIINSFAASPSASIEAESGTISGNASIVGDNNASSGQAVKFGGATAQTLNCAPTSANTMTNTVSHLCGFADTTNTGVPAGTTLYSVPSQITGPTAQTGSGWTYNSGEIDATQNNALIKNISCPCDVVFNGYTGGTIEDSDLSDHGTNSWVVTLRHASGTIIKSNNLHGTGSTPGNGCDSAVRDIYADSENITVENNNVWWCSDPMNNITLGGLIEQNYFHDIAFADPASGNHLEDLQTEDPGSSTRLTIQDNTFFEQHTDETAAIILSTDNGGNENNRFINHNLLAGGGYTFYGGGGPSSASTNIIFTNNHISPIFVSTGGGYGPDTYWTSGGSDVWSGNVWDNTGATWSP